MKKSVTLAILLLPFLAPALLGDPFTGHFSDIETELVRRRDGDFEGPLDKAAKKQQKAVLKSLKLIGKDADDLGDDLKTAGKVSPLVEKAFADELSESEPEAPLPTALGSLRSGMLDAVQDARTALEVRQSNLSEKSHRSVRKQVVKAAMAHLDGLFKGPSKKGYKSLGKAAKAAARGHGAADKSTGQGTGVPGLRVVSIADSLEDKGAEASYETGTGRLTVSGQFSLKGGGTATLTIVVTGAFEPGVFTLGEPGDSVTWDDGDLVYELNPEAVWFNVTVVDTESSRMAGVFELGVIHEEEDFSSQFVLQAGEFNVSDVEITAGD